MNDQDVNTLLPQAALLVERSPLRPGDIRQHSARDSHCSPRSALSMQSGGLPALHHVRRESECPPVTDSHAQSLDDNIWARNLRQADDHDVSAGRSLASPPCTEPTSVSPGPPRKRVKFAGEALAHSMLPHMDGHAELTLTSEHDRFGKVNRCDLARPVGPRALRPHGQRPWFHADCQQHLDLLSHLPPEDRYYLFTVKKVFHYPQVAVGKALISTFFESVYPLLPIVDRSKTAGLADDLYKGEPSCPLLIHAIMFAACQHIDEEYLHQAGFSNITDAKSYFFRRAQLLYHFDCEPEHLAVVQSLILFSQWWMDYTEEKDMRYWLGCAANLAHSMGMHRTISSTLDIPQDQRKLWRRIFWTLLVSHSVNLLDNTLIYALDSRARCCPCSWTTVWSMFEGHRSTAALPRGFRRKYTMGTSTAAVFT